MRIRRPTSRYTRHPEHTPTNLRYTPLQGQWASRPRQRHPPERLHRAQHEARIDVGDAGLCEQADEAEAGEVFEVADGDLKQVVNVAGRRVAGDEFVPFV